MESDKDLISIFLIASLLLVILLLSLGVACQNLVIKDLKDQVESLKNMIGKLFD